jgi:4-hydroxy-tetrahydrodipicolinate synthase
MAEIRGVITAMVTPFAADGSLDEAGARRLARHLVDGGCHGLVVAGTTGEAPTLSDAETLTLLRAVCDEVGSDAVVICGTGTNDTAHTVEMTAAAAGAGADAALVVTPYYNKPTFDGLRGHYEAVAGVGLPVILYNIPSRVVVNVSPAELAELGQIDGVTAVKQANDDELGPIEGLDLLAGNDRVFCRTLELGGSGGILVAANLIPAQMRMVWDAAEAGDFERAREVDASLAPVYEAMEVTTNPIPIKAALEMAGLIDNGAMRLPMVAATEEQRSAIRPALEAAGILAAAG